MELKHQPLSETKLKPPSLYKVILHNDDITTMDFVVFILTYVFHKSPQEAVTLMLKVHHIGSAVCGVYAKDIAYTKQKQALKLAKDENFPLIITVERE